MLDTNTVSIVIGIWIIVSFLFIGVVEKRKLNRKMKYIPALLCLLGIVGFALKLLFISKGFEGIIDIVAIQIGTVLLLFAFIPALMIDMRNNRRR